METKEKVSTPNRTPSKELINLYHKHCSSLPKVRKYPLSTQSQKNLRQGWREHPDVDWWIEYFKQIEFSAFLTGKVEPPPGRNLFVADFHWIILPSRMERILNGRYDDRKTESVWDKARRGEK